MKQKVLKRTEFLYHWECDGKMYEIRTDEKAAEIAESKGWAIDYGEFPPVERFARERLLAALGELSPETDSATAMLIAATRIDRLTAATTGE